ncbi:hypothetical protein KQI84_13580 [bacterium]|nr:hypothetical protein [bacterium]
MLPEVLSSPHVVFGVLGTFAAFAVYIETLGSDPDGRRLRLFSAATALLIWLAFLAGGAFYVTLYGPDKAIILDGPWPWAHKVVMETKEHWAILLPLLASALPLVVAEKALRTSPGNLRVARAMAGLIVFLGLAMEGFGAILSYGIRLGLSQ